MCESFKRENSIFKKKHEYIYIYIYIPKQILKKEYTWLKSWNKCTLLAYMYYNYKI